MSMPAQPRGKKWGSIQSRLFILLLSIFIPVLAVQGYLYYDRYQALKGSEFQANLEIARAASTAFGSFIANIIDQELSIGLAITSSQRMLPSDINRLLKGSRDNTAVRDFTWMNPAGEAIYSSNDAMIGRNYSDRSYFREVADGREWKVGELIFAKTTGEEVFGISRGIRDDKGALLGIVFAAIVPEKLVHILAFERSKDAGVSLIDSKGIHVIRWPKTEYTWEQRNWLKHYPIIAEVLAGNEATSIVTSEKTGKNRIVAFTPVPEIGWLVAASRAEADIVAPIYAAMLPQGILFLITLSIAVFFALALSRPLVTSISRLRDHALALGLGRMDKIQISGPSEIQDLSDAFNRMTEEIKLREEALRESEERFRVAQELSPDGFLIFRPLRDSKGVITDFLWIYENDAAARMNDTNSKEVCGKKVSEVLPHHDKSTFHKAYKEVAETGEVRVVEEAFYDQDTFRQPRWFRVAAVPTTGGDVAILVQDVTERKRAEEALRESEMRFRSVVENMSEGLMLFDEHGMIYQNPASLRIHGFRGSQETRIEHKDLPTTWKGWDETGRPLSFEQWPVSRVLRLESFQNQVLRAVGVETGREFWASYNGFPIVGAGGELALGFITIRDITETKRAEEALRESEAKLSAVIEQLPIGVALINNEGQSILSNTSYQRYEARCVPSKDPERKNCWKAYSPDGRLLPQDQWAAARALGGEYVSPGLECQYTDDAGHETWVQVSAVPFRVERDETARAIVTIEDISERKQAEASLRESEERFRIMADGLPLLVWVHDAEGRQQLVNQTFCEYFGVTREEMKEGRWQVLMHPDDAEAYASDFMACVRDHRNFNAQARVKRADGQWRWIESWGRPRMDSTGRYLGYVGTSADITDRKQAEEALRETEERFRLALRNAPVSVAAQDRDLKYIWAYNQKTAPPEAIIGKSDYEIFTPEEAAHITAMKRRVLEEDIILKDRMWFNRPSGPIFLEVCWEPLHDQTGRVRGVASATIDMTSMKQTEEEFKNLNEKLEFLVQERTRIAEDRARQLQALAVELTEAEEQERRRIAQLLHDDLQQILAASRMQLETACMDLPHVPLIESVRQLLQESVLKTRSLSHELSPAVLHQAGIVTALQWLASRIHEQFGLHVQFESDGEAQISKSKFDSFIFRSVQELLFNINKHANTKDAIVRFSITNGSYVVTVLDKGKGFDTSLLNSFDPKAGFGLLTIKERANYIGGNLLIESEVGQGSRFTLTVPIIKHKPDNLNSSDDSIIHIEAELNTTKTGLRVLFVDDHKVIRNGLIKLIAGQPDIQVIGEASNGSEAIDAARQRRPDVIVMDISMPELDGIEATKIIKSEMPEIRIIGLTMHDDEHIIKQMLSAGAEATLNKSTSTPQLLKTIYGRIDLRN
jgi:PAS domain S-box-containing protein